MTEWENILGKKTKVNVDISRYLPYTLKNDYTQSFKGLNSKRKSVGIIITQIKGKTIKQIHNSRSNYVYEVQFDNGYIIKNLQYYNLDLV
jgi:hypothetical protein